MISDWQREVLGLGARAELGSPGTGDLGAPSDWAKCLTAVWGASLLGAVKP